MKYLIKTSGRKSSQAAHELAEDGITANCSQKRGFPRAGVGGWEIREFVYRPWVVCSRCQEIRLAAERERIAEVERLQAELKTLTAAYRRLEETCGHLSDEVQRRRAIDAGVIG